MGGAADKALARTSIRNLKHQLWKMISSQPRSMKRKFRMGVDGIPLKFPWYNDEHVITKAMRSILISSYLFGFYRATYYVVAHLRLTRIGDLASGFYETDTLYTKYPHLVAHATKLRLTRILGRSSFFRIWTNHHQPATKLLLIILCSQSFATSYVCQEINSWIKKSVDREGQQVDKGDGWCI